MVQIKIMKEPENETSESARILVGRGRLVIKGEMGKDPEYREVDESYDEGEGSAESMFRRATLFSGEVEMTVTMKISLEASASYVLTVQSWPFGIQGAAQVAKVATSGLEISLSAKVVSTSSTDTTATASSTRNAATTSGAIRSSSTPTTATTSTIDCIDHPSCKGTDPTACTVTDIAQIILPLCPVLCGMCVPTQTTITTTATATATATTVASSASTSSSESSTTRTSSATTPNEKVLVSTIVLDAFSPADHQNEKNLTAESTSNNLQEPETTSVAQTDFGNVFVMKRDSASSSIVDALVDLAWPTFNNTAATATNNGNPSSSTDNGESTTFSDVSNATNRGPTVTMGILTRSVTFRITSNRRRDNAPAVPCAAIAELVGMVQLTARFAEVVLSTTIVKPKDILTIISSCENIEANLAVVHFNVYLLKPIDRTAEAAVSTGTDTRTDISYSPGSVFTTAAVDTSTSLSSSSSHAGETEDLTASPKASMYNLVAKLESALDKSSDRAASKLNVVTSLVSSQLTLIREEPNSVYNDYKQPAWSSDPLTPTEVRDVVLDLNPFTEDANENTTVPTATATATPTVSTALATTTATTPVLSISTSSDANEVVPTVTELSTTSSTSEEPPPADGKDDYGTSTEACYDDTAFGLIIFQDSNKMATPNRETGLEGEVGAIINQVNSLLFSFAAAGQQRFSKVTCASGERGVLWATLHISADSTRSECNLAKELLYDAIEAQGRVLVFSFQNEAFPVLGFVPMECEQVEVEEVNAGSSNGTQYNGPTTTAALTLAPTGSPPQNAGPGNTLAGNEAESGTFLGNETTAAALDDANEMSISNYLIVAGTSLGAAGLILVVVWACRRATRPRERAPWESLKEDLQFSGYHTIDEELLRGLSRARLFTPEMVLNGGGMAASTVASSDCMSYCGEDNIDPVFSKSDVSQINDLVSGINHHGLGNEQVSDSYNGTFSEHSGSSGPPVPKSRRPTKQGGGFKPPGRSQFHPQHKSALRKSNLAEDGQKAKEVRFGSEQPAANSSLKFGNKMDQWAAGRAQQQRQTQREPAIGNRYHDDASINRQVVAGSPQYAELNESRMRRGHSAESTARAEHVNVDPKSLNPGSSSPANVQLSEHRNSGLNDLNLDFFATDVSVGQSRAKSGKVRGLIEQSILGKPHNELEPVEDAGSSSNGGRGGGSLPFPFQRSPSGLVPAPPYPSSSRQVSFGFNATRANDLSGRGSHAHQHDETPFTFGGSGDGDSSSDVHADGADVGYEEDSYSIVDGDEENAVYFQQQMRLRNSQQFVIPTDEHPSIGGIEFNTDETDPEPVVQVRSAFAFGRSETANTKFTQDFGDDDNDDGNDDLTKSRRMNGRVGTQRRNNNNTTNTNISREQPGYMLAGHQLQQPGYMLAGSDGLTAEVDADVAAPHSLVVRTGSRVIFMESGDSKDSTSPEKHAFAATTNPSASQNPNAIPTNRAKKRVHFRRSSRSLLYRPSTSSNSDGVDAAGGGGGVLAQLPPFRSNSTTATNNNGRPSSIYAFQDLEHLNAETEDEGSTTEAPTEDLEELWAGLGHAQAAINLQQTADPPSSSSSTSPRLNNNNNGGGGGGGGGTSHTGPWMADAEGMYDTSTMKRRSGPLGNSSNAGSY